jgi:hypothetical protein
MDLDALESIPARSKSFWRVRSDFDALEGILTASKSFAAR